MSFSSDVKAEICKDKIDKKCCAIAEALGVLLYCHTFSPVEIRITTANDDFANRLPLLFKKAFGVSFDVVPSESACGKRSFIIADKVKLTKIFDAFDADINRSIELHVNYGILEDTCCRTSFIRGAFLAGGSVTDPDKRYHLEIATFHKSVARETLRLLNDMSFTPKESYRGGNSLLYFKQSEAISDFLTTIGASTMSMKVMTAKVEKEMRNTITRQINCDSANADKTVAAAQCQLQAIRKFANEYGLDGLPDQLKEAALLRITNPEASLSDLAKLAIPPVSKSCLSHRLKKIITLVSENQS